MIDADSPGPARAAAGRWSPSPREAHEPAPLSAVVRDVVMVVSSSRSGSSFLMELLARARGLVHLQGETGPLLRRAGLDPWSTRAGSDALGAEHCSPAARGALDREMAREAGSRAPTPGGAGVDLDRFAVDIHRRLALQWPGEEIAPATVRAAVAATLAQLGSRDGTAAEPADPARFTASFLRRLRRDHPAIHPYYYDLPPDLLAGFFPGLASPLGPPSDHIVEEPPFLCFAPRRPTAGHELASQALVLKSPSNAYRLPFFRALFPRARLRLLHLTRNPAASVNGLIDGWLYRGFHAHRMPRPLQIAGYADVRPHDARWWKFDLPPGWPDWTGRPLAEVCGFQWCAAHEAILAYAAASGAPYLRVAFEDLVGDRERGERAVARICAWLGVAAERELTGALAAGLPPVMRTRAPRDRRWTERAGQLAPVLADPRVRRLVGELDYEDEAAWI